MSIIKVQHIVDILFLGINLSKVLNWIKVRNHSIVIGAFLSIVAYIFLPLSYCTINCFYIIDL